MSFMKCVSSLRLLGKFLGFVAFLPYQTPDLLPDSVKESYVSMRDQVGCGCLVYGDALVMKLIYVISLKLLIRS